MVRDDDRWITFSAFLASLEEPTTSMVGASGYKLQYDWWRVSKKPFRFLDLPTEIQRHILLYGIGERVAPRRETVRNVTVLTMGGDKIHTRKIDGDCTAPALVRRSNDSLLYLSKATRALALAVLNEDTVKVYPSFVCILFAFLDEPLARCATVELVGLRQQDQANSGVIAYRSEQC